MSSTAMLLPTSCPKNNEQTPPPQRSSIDQNLCLLRDFWHKLAHHEHWEEDVLPEGSRSKHLFWALHFLKVHPLQAPGFAVVGASGGAVDPKTHCKWVWAFIDAITECVNEVVSNHSVRTAQIVVFFVMMPCDSADAPKRIKCWQTLGNTKYWLIKQLPFFHTRPHPPDASAANATDQL
jgi:hypothetical protein